MDYNVLRFFLAVDEFVSVQKKYDSNQFIPIPRIGETVWFEQGVADYDFYVVSNVEYGSYSDNGVLIDVTVEGKYFYEEE